MSLDIEKLLEEARGGGNSTPANDMTDMQQAAQLRDSMAAYVNPIHFKVGDFVRYRSECKGFIHNHARLHIILEVYAKPIVPPFDENAVGSCVAYRKYDVVVGVTCTKTKGAVMKYVADSRDLEYFPDHDRLTAKPS